MRSPLDKIRLVAKVKDTFFFYMTANSLLFPFIVFFIRYNRGNHKIPFLILANRIGIEIYIFNKKKERFIPKHFQKLENTVHSLEICPRGLFIFIGFVSGEVLIFQIRYLDTSHNLSNLFIDVMNQKEEGDFKYGENESERKNENGSENESEDDAELCLNNISFYNDTGGPYQPNLSFCPPLIKVSPGMPRNNQTQIKQYKKIDPSFLHTNFDNEKFRNVSPSGNKKELTKKNDFSKISSEIDNANNNYENKISINIIKDEYGDDLNNGREGHIYEHDRIRREKDRESDRDRERVKLAYNKVTNNSSNNSPRNSEARRALEEINKKKISSDISQFDLHPCTTYCTFAIAWHDGRITMNSIIKIVEDRDHEKEKEEECYVDRHHRSEKIDENVEKEKGKEDKEKEKDGDNENKQIHQYNDKEYTDGLTGIRIETNKTQHLEIGLPTTTDENKKKYLKKEIVTYRWITTKSIKTNENFCKLEFYIGDINQSLSNLENDVPYCIALSLSGTCYFLDLSDNSDIKNRNNKNRKNNNNNCLTDSNSKKIEIFSGNLIKDSTNFKDVYTYNSKLFLSCTESPINEEIDDIQLAKNFIVGKSFLFYFSFIQVFYTESNYFFSFLIRF